MLIDRSLCFEEDEDSEYIIYDDIKQAVAPYLDSAIERKEKNLRDGENIYWFVLIHRLSGILRRKTRDGKNIMVIITAAVRVAVNGSSLISLIHGR